MAYGLDSPFDMEMHKRTFINYMEAVILPSGEVQYAVPSHQEKLIAIFLADNNHLTREQLWEIIPIWVDVIAWLQKYTGCISVWSDFYAGDPTTPEQKATLDLLIEHELTRRK
jgi:hypothetical protein